MREEKFIEAALPPAANHRAGTLDEALVVVAQEPAVVQASLYTAVVAGDAEAAAKFIQADPGLAKEKGGPNQWKSRNGTVRRKRRREQSQ